MALDPAHIMLDIRSDVERWDTLEARPTGSRDKVTVSDPKSHRLMIFKRPKEGREYQIWSELLGSFIAGDMLGWPVQRTGLGIRQGCPGNLLAYFFDPDAGEELVEGWRLCLTTKPDFDYDVGTDHSLFLLRRVVDTGGLERYGISAVDFWLYWARAIAFDCLISNTDRHAENWGILKSASGNRMAPLYDNATSLGCGVDEKGLARFFGSSGVDAKRIDDFACRGRHHLRIEGQHRHGTSFVDLIRVFIAEFPEHRSSFEEVAALDLDPARGLLHDLVALGFPSGGWGHATGRVEHIHAILSAGQSRVRRALGT